MYSPPLCHAEDVHDHGCEARKNGRAFGQAFAEPDTPPARNHDSDHQHRNQHHGQIELTEFFNEIQAPADLEWFVVGTFQLAKDFFRNPRPEVAPRFGTLRIMDVVRHDIVDEIWSHVPRSGQIRPFSRTMTLGESVAPVFFEGDKIAIKDFEL